MEYLEGVTLKSLIAARTLDLERILATRVPKLIEAQWRPNSHASQQLPNIHRAFKVRAGQVA
jgi:hypothetical protein